MFQYQCLNPISKVGLDGFTNDYTKTEEIEKAVKSGVVPITLGKRILRTETAGMTAIANTLFYLDM